MPCVTGHLCSSFSVTSDPLHYFSLEFSEFVYLSSLEFSEFVYFRNYFSEFVSSCSTCERTRGSCSGSRDSDDRNIQAFLEYPHVTVWQRQEIIV